MGPAVGLTFITALFCGERQHMSQLVAAWFESFYLLLQFEVRCWPMVAVVWASVRHATSLANKCQYQHHPIAYYNQKILCCSKTSSTQKTDMICVESFWHGMCQICYIEVWGPAGPRLLAGDPSGLLTSSFVPFGRSGRYVGPEREPWLKLIRNKLGLFNFLLARGQSYLQVSFPPHCLNGNNWR